MLVGRGATGPLFAAGAKSGPGDLETGGSPFTELPTVATLAAVLAGDTTPELAGYAPLLEEAAIDVELAAEMTATELAAVLPAGTPIGHALRLRKLCTAAVADAARPRALIPKSAAWQQGARIIAAGSQQGDLTDTVRSQMDMTLIISSLFLTM